jgi:cytoskeletal protein RodZ
MKTCSKCGRIFADDTLVFCTEDGMPLSAPVTQQSDLPPTVLDEQPTLHLPIAFVTNQTEKKTNALPWWLFGSAVIVIVGLVGVLVLVVASNFLWSQPLDKNENQTQTQNQNSSNKNENKNEEDVETTLRRLNDEIGAAFRRSDVELLEGLLAENYVYQDDRGLYYTKQQIITWLQTGDVSYEYIASSNVAVSVDLNKRRANVTGSGIIKGVFKGNLFVDVVTFSNIYEKSNSQWQLVSVTARH